MVRTGKFLPLTGRHCEEIRNRKTPVAEVWFCVIWKDELFKARGNLEP